MPHWDHTFNPYRIDNRGMSGYFKFSPVRNGEIMSANTVEITDTNFESEVLKSEVPVLIDFWAPWCGPCKAIAPSIDELATEYDGKVKFVKINVDENPQTPARYGVRGIPNLIIIK